jgi:hypothetical protein
MNGRKGTPMNTLFIIGVILLVLGTVGIVYGGITYTAHEDVMDVGDLHMQVDHSRQIPVSPIGGAAAVAVGVALMLVGRRQPVQA